MVTCIVKGCDNKSKRYLSTMFHRIPTNKRKSRLMKHWLAALDKDLKTPLETIKKWRVCSEHFGPDDYLDSFTGSTTRRLKDTTIPTIFKVQIGQQRESSTMTGELDIKQEQPEQQDPYSLSAGVPWSTLQKSRPALLPLQLSSLALAPTWTQLDTASSPSVVAVWKSLIVDETHTSSLQDISSTSALDLSMGSEHAANNSFAPFTSPSTSTTGSTSSNSEEPRGWKERQWVVNESKLMELFQKCFTCGAPMSEADQTIKRTGSRIAVSWKCYNGHTGHWESCPNI